MNAERLRAKVGIDKFANSVERDMAGLMFDHWGKIAELLPDLNKPIQEAHWAMDWQEMMVKGEKVKVIAGLLPAHDENGHEIPEMRGTPSVFCIPESQFKEGDWELFSDGNKQDASLQEQREQVVKQIISNPDILKLYNMHGWGANPYAFVRPMADLAADHKGISVLLGLMGSMGTTYQDKRPHRFGKTAKYEWFNIRKQALGAMYYLEVKEAFGIQKHEAGDKKFKRVIVGHSMQGKTALRLLFDELAQLPSTYFVSMTPVMVGSDRGAKSLMRALQYMKGPVYQNHVILGNDPAGWVMKAELEIVGRVLGAEARASFLTMILPIVQGIVENYTKEGDPYGQDLVILAHLLEYIENPWAIMRATKVLDGSPPVASPDTLTRVGSMADRLLLVIDGKDKVLNPKHMRQFAEYVANQIPFFFNVREAGEVLLVDGDKDTPLNVLYFDEDNHYPRETSWDRVSKGIGTALEIINEAI